MSKVEPTLGHVDVRHGLEFGRASRGKPPPVTGLMRIVSGVDTYGSKVEPKSRGPHGFFATYGHGYLDRWAAERASELALRTDGERLEIFSDFASAAVLHATCDAEGQPLTVLDEVKHADHLPLYFRTAALLREIGQNDLEVYIDTHNVDELAPNEARLIVVGGEGGNTSDMVETIAMAGIAAYEARRHHGQEARSALEAGAFALIDTLTGVSGRHMKAS